MGASACMLFGAVMELMSAFSSRGALRVVWRVLVAFLMVFAGIYLISAYRVSSK